MFDIIIAENWDRNLLINKEPHMHQKPGGKNYCLIKYILSHHYHFSLLLFSEILGEKIGIIPVFKFPDCW